MRFLVGGLVLLLGIVSHDVTLAAHAYLVQVDPPAGAARSLSPEKVIFLFSEEIESKFSSFTLYDAHGQLLKELAFTPEEGGLRVVVPLERLSDGIYTVAWKVLSAIDGHITKGVYPFGVGAHAEHSSHASTEPVTGTGTALDPVRVLSRWLHYLSLVTLMGMLIFTRFILAEQPFARVLSVLWGLAILTSCSELLLYAQSVGELSARVLFGTQVGLLWSVKIGLLAMVGPTMLWHRKRLWARAGLVIGVGALISGVQSSHSAALRDPLALVFDGLHLVAVAIWAGGLLSLGLLAWRSREGVPWGVVLPRFSQWALLSVMVIIGSGVYLSFKHVGSLAALWSTNYGRFLVLKIAMLVAILAMAALNFRQVRRDFRGDYGQTDFTPLRRRVWGEFFTIVLVLGAAGALTLSPPAHRPTAAQGAEPPTVLAHETGGIRVVLTISSLRVGPARFTVQLRDARGQPISAVQRVTLEFLYAESQELGALSIVAPENSTGGFEAVGSYLSLAGRWQIVVQVRFSDRAEDVRAVFEVRALGSADALRRFGARCFRSPVRAPSDLKCDSATPIFE